MANIINDKKYLGPRDIVSYILSAHYDGSGVETLVKKTDKPVRAIKKLQWNNSSSTLGHIELYWEMDSASPQFIIRLNDGNGVVDFIDMGILLESPAGSTGHILLSTTDYSNKDSYTLIMKVEE